MKEKTINLLGIREKMILSRINNKFITVMEAITEEDEKRIDECIEKNKYIKFNKGDKIIDEKSICTYGSIDVNNPDDIKIINKLGLIDEAGATIHSNFNFDAGTFTTIDRKAKFYTTWKPIDWFKYCYCLIGKPARIIVYKDIIVKSK